jgi:MoaA/NifB/PqqE/SkfB family radical SAM enzyme
MLNAVDDLSFPFLLGTGGTRLIQIQSTSRCNLRCLHCYAEGSADKSDELSLKQLRGFLSESFDMGYRYIGVSGGEPLLWRDLLDFLEFSNKVGFSTAVTTNGTLLNRDLARKLQGLAGIVAVSVDGPPEEHAKIRRSTTAFTLMKHGLSVLRDANVPFTLSFTLTKYNADKLSWIYDFADKEGALGFSVHPLCAYGGAGKNLSDAVPDSYEFKISSYLLALLMEKRGSGGPAVTMDVIKKPFIDKSCWPLICKSAEDLSIAKFSDLVPSLVVEEDGCIVPFIYGFPRKWSVGFIDENNLWEEATKWKSAHATSVAELLQRTLNRLQKMNVEFFDLFGELLVSAKDY